MNHIRYKMGALVKIAVIVLIAILFNWPLWACILGILLVSIFGLIDFKLSWASEPRGKKDEIVLQKSAQVGPPPNQGSSAQPALPKKIHVVHSSAASTSRRSSSGVKTDIDPDDLIYPIHGAGYHEIPTETEEKSWLDHALGPDRSSNRHDHSPTYEPSSYSPPSSSYSSHSHSSHSSSSYDSGSSSSSSDSSSSSSDSGGSGSCD